MAAPRAARLPAGAAAAAAAALLLAGATAAFEPPKGYRLDDPAADHDRIGRQLAEGGRLADAVLSFKAGCRFSKDANVCANLGVALMRNKDFGGAYKALAEGLRRDPNSAHVKENLEALYTFAGQQGFGRAEVRRLGEGADLGLEDAVSGRGGGGSGGGAAGGGDRESSPEEPHAGDARKPIGPKQIAKRGRELVKRGEKRLGRGYMSLALHINPWVARELPSWFSDAMRAEELLYWRGNLFVGSDKTYVESLASDHFAGAQEPECHELALYTWRNLELTGMSCCGIDNLAVFLSRVRSWGHPYLVPFLHLTPEYLPHLKPENQKMYSGFKKWWEGGGKPAMPEPAITYSGNGRWEWPAMRVRLPAKRVPRGWDEMVQAVLLLRLRHFEDARAAARQALRANADLASVIDELLPGMEEIPVWEPGPHPASEGKYVICYNPFVGLGNLAVVMVSAHALAKITGRTFILHWNINQVSRHAFRLKERPGVLSISAGADEVGVLTESAKPIYLFHMMDSAALADNLELLGCSDVTAALDKYQAVTVSSNLFFAPVLGSNPNVAPGAVPDFPELLSDLLAPGPRAISRALSLANKTEFAKQVPVVAVHIRAREEAEDNDDWPTKDSPEEGMLARLAECLGAAVAHELGAGSSFDVFLAATTEKARSGAAAALKKKAAGLKRVLTMPNLERNRRSSQGATDAMAEALLISRASLFVRLVVGTSGFSTFAFLANALRYQTEWATSLPPLRGEGYMPNYVVTDDCGRKATCFRAPPKVRMADVTWHGKAVVERSCGNVITRFQPDSKCGSLEPVARLGPGSAEL